jgi:predicted Zn-ribbon and HTH transcriptional regulator
MSTLQSARRKLVAMPDQTVRQQIMELIAGTSRTARQLAELVGIPERQVEEHLVHIVRSVAHDRTRRFLLEPSACQNCGFVFRSRTRLTRPSRCPRCRSEDIAPPRFGIELHALS